MLYVFGGGLLMNINDNELKNILKLNNILKSNDEVTATTIHEEHMNSSEEFHFP